MCVLNNVQSHYFKLEAQMKPYPYNVKVASDQKDEPRQDNNLVLIYFFIEWLCNESS